mgnify:CR=1 FL=1
MKFVMDGKATRNYLYFKSASSAPSSWAVSVLKKLFLPRSSPLYKYQNDYAIQTENGLWEQRSLFPEDCNDISNYDILQASQSSDIPSIIQYLNQKGDDDTPVLLLTNSEILRKKIKVNNIMYSKLPLEKREKHNEEAKLKWLKGNAKNLGIEFYGIGDDDDIRDTMIGCITCICKKC